MSLHFHGVSVSYRRRAVFENINLRVAPGETAGLIGPNGAGKTTMLRTAAGLIRPATGKVVRDGAVMYFAGEGSLPGTARADKWSSLFASHSPARTRIARLSRGTRQLLGLTACLTRDDWAIGLFDEPWEGLDPPASRWLTAILRRHSERGAAILISSHRLHDAAEVCSSYAFLANGVLRPLQPAGIARAFDEFTKPWRA